MRKLVVVWLAALVLLPGTAQAAEEPATAGEWPPEFGHLVPAAHAFALTAGPDGNLWFAGARTGGEDLTIGKVTPSGEVTQYPQPSRGGYVYSIALGPDGNLWFTEWGKGAIGRITPGGDATSFRLPGRQSRPTAIVAGADGNLWFTDGKGSGIGRITPSGEITEFALPAGRHPGAIAAGADGNLWFTERAADRIGRITTAGQITEFPIPGPAVKPGAIVAGSDGNLWFAEGGAPRIGRITPGGEITHFTLPTADSVYALAAGPEGRIWFTAGDLIGAIGADGPISWPACLLEGCRETPAALAFAPDGRLWVSTDYLTCSYCGGQTFFNLRLRPGGVGPYVLPPVRLGLGPRATPIRKGATSLLLVCGLPGGCRGQARLTTFEWRKGDRQIRVLGRARYSLTAGKSRRIRVPLTDRALGDIREWPREAGDYPYFANAEAGPRGAIETRQGAVILRFPGRRGG